MIPIAPRDVAQPSAPEAEGEVPRWLLALERAHALAHRAARALEAAPASFADLRPAARTLEPAIGSLYAAFDRQGDPLAATRRAATDLDATARLLDPLVAADPALEDATVWLREARAALAIAEERFARVAPEPPDPRAPLTASRDVPTLHRIERRAIVPSLRVADPLPPPPEPPPPLPKPSSLAELDATMAEVKRRAEARKAARKERDEARKQAEAHKRAEAEAEPAQGFARGAFKALSKKALCEQRARECFDEVAMLGMQRAPLLGEAWRSAKVLEDRMLAAIDAIAALGTPALARLESLVFDAPTKDPTRGFAIAMILGCFDGRDALGMIERALFHLGPSDPEVARSVGAALKLVPHPRIALTLRALFADPDPAVRALGIEVLGYRDIASPAELAAAARDASPLVVAAALPALGHARPPELSGAIELARAHAEPALREAAWIAMLVSGHPHAAYVLSTELDGPLAERAALPLAIVGDEADAARLAERARSKPSAALVTALGWAGQPEAVPLLIDLLAQDEPALQLAAAYALERITGAGFYDEVDVPPEEIDVADVPEPAGVNDDDDASQRPLPQLVGDAREKPSAGASETIFHPTLDVNRWKAYWDEKGPDYRAGAKYRRGNAYTPLVSLWELDALPLTAVERRWLGRELVVRTGHFVRFDPHDFVAVQEESLRAWRPIAQRMSGSPGSWGVPVRR